MPACQWVRPRRPLGLVCLCIALLSSCLSARATSNSASRPTTPSSERTTTPQRGNGASANKRLLEPSGPKLYGDPDFWVLLKDLSVSEGRIAPKFQPEGEKFEVTIKNAKAPITTMYLSVDLQKYDVNHPPEILVDGKALKYRIIDQVAIDVPLNDTHGVFDRTIVVTVRDPQQSGSWFSRAAEHKYEIRVMQAPEIDKVVAATSIQVFDESGHEIPSQPLFDPTSATGHYQYVLKATQDNLELQVKCPQEATSQAYDGSPVPLNGTKKVSIAGTVSTVLAQCMYEDSRWTHGKQFQRTYVLTFTVESELEHTGLDLRMIPDQGYCDGDADDPSKGFICRAVQDKGSYLVVFNNSHAEVTLVHTKTGTHTRMFNALPIELFVEKGAREDYTLLMQAGDQKREYPVQILRPALCHEEFSCPVAWKLNNSTIARSILCRWEQCGDHDIDNCCHGISTGPPTHIEDNTSQAGTSENPTVLDNVSALCDTYTCPAGYMLFANAQKLRCKSKTCSPEDQATCCHKAVSCFDFMCPVGHAHLTPQPSDKPMVCPLGDPSCVGICCFEMKMCDSYTCPAAYERREEAAKISCDSGTCSSELCCRPLPVCRHGASTFRCPTSMILKEDALSIEIAQGTNSDIEPHKCCDARGKCSDYSCTGGLVLKPSAKSLFCRGRECDSADEETCCYASGTCYGFSCPAGMALRATPEQLRCSSAQCTHEDSATCCEASNAQCSTFDCPSTPVPYGLKPTATSTFCTSSVCGDPDVDTCCEQQRKCPEMSCPEGFVMKEMAVSMWVNEWDKYDCCERRGYCSYYSCPVGFRPKAGVASLLCSRRDCTDADAGVCCEKAPLPFTDAGSVHPEIQVYAQPAEAECAQIQTGFWCEALKDTIELALHLQEGNGTKVQHLAPIQVPTEGEATKHLTVTLRRKLHGSKSHVSIWISRRQDSSSQASVTSRRLLTQGAASLRGAEVEPVPIVEILV